MTQRKAASKKVLSYRGILRKIDLHTDNLFSPKDWEEVKKYFKCQCVYCGTPESKTERLQKDHAIPMNRKWLGLHRRGNIVPACPRCNRAKSDRRFIGFCRWQDKNGKQATRGSKAEKDIKDYMKYMKEKGNNPKLRLGKNAAERKKIQKIIDDAHEQAKAVRDGAVEKLKQMVNKKQTKKPSSKK